MIDNRKVKDSHREGIKRKIVSRGEMKKSEKSEPGKMKEKGSANWSRKGSPLTPRKA